MKNLLTDYFIVWAFNFMLGVLIGVLLLKIRDLKRKIKESEIPEPMSKADVVIIRDHNKRVLMLKRHDFDRRSSGWCLPGGKHESHDTLLGSCGLREVYEETGISLSILDLNYTHSYVSKIEGKPDILVRVFSCLTKYNSVIPIKLSNEHQDYKWLDRGQLRSVKLAGNTEKALKRYL